MLEFSVLPAFALHLKKRKKKSILSHLADMGYYLLALALLQGVYLKNGN